MCSLCLRTPCVPQCPNAEEPRPIYICSECGAGIYPGEKVFIAPEKGPICKECITGMSALEMMELLGETMDTVEKDF